MADMNLLSYNTSNLQQKEETEICAWHAVMLRVYCILRGMKESQVILCENQCDISCKCHFAGE
jgi:hypothetical protein